LVRVWGREEHEKEEEVGRIRLLIPIVGPKGSFPFTTPTKWVLGTYI
jgi:hypothetical protein